MYLNKKCLFIVTLAIGLAFFLSSIQAEENLTAYYSFDTEEAKDLSGNGLDVTIMGGPPELIEGMVGKAWQFNGSLKVEMDYDQLNKLTVTCGSVKSDY